MKKPSNFISSFTSHTLIQELSSTSFILSFFFFIISLILTFLPHPFAQAFFVIDSAPF